MVLLLNAIMSVCLSETLVSHA